MTDVMTEELLSFSRTFSAIELSIESNRLECNSRQTAFVCELNDNSIILNPELRVSTFTPIIELQESILKICARMSSSLYNQGRSWGKIYCGILLG